MSTSMQKLSQKKTYFTFISNNAFPSFDLDIACVVLKLNNFEDKPTDEEYDTSKTMV